MILDEKVQLPPSMRHGPSSSQSSISFPPRGHDDYSNRASQAALHEPLLPTVLRQSDPYAFPNGSSSATAQSRLCNAPWFSSRGRHKIVVIASSFAVLLFVYSQFSHPRFGHPPWQGRPPPPFPPGPMPPNFEQEHGPGWRDNAAGALVGAPPPPVDATAVAGGAETVGFINGDQDAAPKGKPKQDVEKGSFILSEEDFVQPRRPIPPADDPWPDMPNDWKGRTLLSEQRQFIVGANGIEKHIRPPNPPARYLLKAYEYLKSTLPKTLRVSPGVSRDPLTGRPNIVPHDKIYFGEKDAWKPPTLLVSKLAKGKGVKKLAKVQFDGKWDNSRSRVAEQNQRRDWVKRAFLHAWDGYKRHAWGHDEIRPITRGSSNNYNGWGATLVDNLDTLLIMNLSAEYNLAREHVQAIDFTYLVHKAAYSTKLPAMEDMDVGDNEVNPPTDDRGSGSPARLTPTGGLYASPSTIPTFETTIRYLGGLLSAYDLSGDPLMLQRAIELGDWILPALGTRHGLALGRYTMGSNPAGNPSGRSILSEVGSLSMEFTRLSMLSGDDIYFKAVQRSTDSLDTAFPKGSNDGSRGGRLGSLLPAYIDPSYTSNMRGEYTFGGLADSYYEYLIKEYQLLGGAMEQYSRMYEEAIESAYEHLIHRVEVVPGREDLTVIGVKQWGNLQLRLDHLTCFAGGMLGLGAKLLHRTEDLKTAKNVTSACQWAYESTSTGVGPESLTFYGAGDSNRYTRVLSEDGKTTVMKPNGIPIGVRQSSAHYMGRPETIESVFYMYRITGDRTWQDLGWQMFTSWIQHAITDVGFATIANVNSPKPSLQDSQESFVLAETLKYYYLLFSQPDEISLDDYVFNTEAHPFRIPKASPTATTSLWSGPDPDEVPISSLVSTMGEGTHVQQWARVQQAAYYISHSPGKAVQAPKNAGAAPIRRPDSPFIRPPEAELEAARKAQGLGGH